MENSEDAFNRSELTRRSPLITNSGTNELGICPKCNKEANESSVTCDICGMLYHNDCCDAREQQEQWLCPICEVQKKKKFSKPCEKPSRGGSDQRSTNTVPTDACNYCHGDSSTTMIECFRCKKAAHKTCCLKMDHDGTKVVICKACYKQLVSRRTQSHPASISNVQQVLQKDSNAIRTENKQLGKSSSVKNVVTNQGGPVDLSGLAKPTRIDGGLQTGHMSSRSSQLSRESARQLLQMEKDMLRLQVLEKERLLQEKEKLFEEKQRLLEEKHNKQLELLQRQLEIENQSSSSSSIRDDIPLNDSLNRTKEWVKQNDEAEIVIPKVQFYADSTGGQGQSKIDHQSGSRQRKVVQSSNQKPGGPWVDRSKADFLRRGVTTNRSSTPAPYLEAKTQEQFLASFMHPSLERESFVEANTTRLTMDQVSARHALPKELPKFAGDPLEWPMFISSYVATTKRLGFSDEENMIRLQRALKGPALEAVQSKLMFPEMAPDVLNTLRMMFGRADLIIDSVLSQVRKEPPVKAEELNRLIKFSISVQNLCATIKAAHLGEHLSNPMLLRELVNKLPASIKLNWGMFKRNLATADLDTFSKWLFDVAEAACEVAPPIFVQSCQSTKAMLKPHKRQNDTEQVYAIDQPKSNENNVHMNCCECNGVHLLDKCPQFIAKSKRERWETVLLHKLCGKCLAVHNFRTCRVKRVCGIEGCKRTHHPLLHKDLNARPREDGAESKGDMVIRADVHTHTDGEPKTMFRIIPVKLYGNGGRMVKTYAFIDEGSSVTLVENEIADLLLLDGSRNELCLKWTGNTTRLESNSRRVSVGISSDTSDSKKYLISDVRTVDTLNLPVQSLDMSKMNKETVHLRNLPIKGYQNAQPKILLGLAHWSLAYPIESREGQGGIIATRSKLGWAISGRSGQGNVVEIVHFHECECNSDDKLHRQVKQYFSLEYFGVRSSSMLHESKDDARAREIMKRNTRRVGARFETSLLWRQDEIELPNSKFMAVRRMLCLESKLKRNPELWLNLREQIADYLKKGYARRLSVEEAERTDARTWYLPLFAVTNPNKPGKIRMVWDAAARVDGISLNSQLLTGPDLLNPLPDVLRRFRQFEWAVTGDIREMFHQIKIRAEDQNSQRFLWRNSPEDEMGTYVMCVMTFGASCSPSLAQYVKNVNATNFQDQFPRAVDAILKNHYVDDYVDSFPTEYEAARVTEEVNQIHSRSGFTMRNWSSNSTEVLERVGESIESTVKDLGVGDFKEGARVLGMCWRISSDTLFFSINLKRIDSALVDGSRRPTKREILRILMMVFDPLGIVAHLLVEAKILLQDVWRSNTGWDDYINEKQMLQWTNWIRVLLQIYQISIPRCYHPAISKKYVDLHIFVDASENIYAAVAYFRVTDDDNVSRCTLVGAKTKVAPQKPLSIPRLELQAAVLGSRLAESVIKGHSIAIRKRTFWSDSTNVLGWIRSDARKYKAFVAFRIGEILESTEVKEWRYVPSKLNVADDATKSKSSPDVSSNTRWFHGPEFLRQDPEFWPKQQNNTDPEVPEEVKIVNIHEPVERGNATPNYMNISRWKILVRSQATVLRVLNNGKARCEKLSGPFSSDELKAAEMEIYRTAQIDSYTDEIQRLQQSPPIHLEKTSSIFTLTPLFDDQRVLRMKGRIGRTLPNVSYDAQFPIILPKDHRITYLVLASYHARYHHHNHETVVNEVRQKFWISKLRITLKKIRKDCQKCKNSLTKPKPPLMADLPKVRLATYTRPFTFTGLDYFGPMDVVVGRRVEKRWGALFTCLTIRAVHIEIAHSLTSDSTIMCIRNFIARRGRPRELWSDNGTNFRGASRELDEALAEVNFTIVASDFDDINWMFIPPAAPHMGGAWERLVRSIKTTLGAVLPNRKPTDELLKCCLMEAESIVNCRPLSYIPIELGATEALTPNHFLLGSSSGSKPPGVFADDVLIHRKNWRIAQHTADHFWKRWIREYLPTITRRTKWYTAVQPVKVGDVGVIWDDQIRGSWKLCRVIDVVVGIDQQVRQLVVKTSTGTYKRPTTKFAPLDVTPQEPVGESPPKRVDSQGGECYGIHDGIPNSITS